MSYQIHLDSDTGDERLFPVLQRSAAAVLTHLQAAPGEATLLLTSAERIRDLNRRFAGHDYATDVLSFPDGSIDPGTHYTYFGDIVIAVSVAEKQARAGNHSLEAEIALLAVHGMLHLLGFDHDTEEAYKAMWAHQGAILTALSYTEALPQDEA